MGSGEAFNDKSRKEKYEIFIALTIAYSKSFSLSGPSDYPTASTKASGIIIIAVSQNLTWKSCLVITESFIVLMPSVQTAGHHMFTHTNNLSKDATEMEISPSKYTTGNQDEGCQT